MSWMPDEFGPKLQRLIDTRISGLAPAPLGPAAHTLGMRRRSLTVLLVWSAIYLYFAIRRVYGSGVIKMLFNLLAIAVAYSAFWALGVTITTLLVILRS